MMNIKDNKLEELFVEGQPDLEPLKRLSKDLKQAARTLSDNEARFLVEAYYTIQENRKRSANQVGALARAQAPNNLMSWIADQSEGLEGQIKLALDYCCPQANWTPAPAATP